MVTPFLALYLLLINLPCNPLIQPSVPEILPVAPAGDIRVFPGGVKESCNRPQL